MLVNWISKDLLRDQPQFGIFLNLASAISAELASTKGFDWLLVDTEHGAGDYGDMVNQLAAMSGKGVVPIVRVLWNDAQLIKRTLDAGAAGIMVPYVNSAREAVEVVAAMRYPPAGTRGVAGTTRATGFGSDMLQYQQTANDSLLTIVQIETPEAIAAADEIASVEGVDVLFVGPADLSFNLGTPGDYLSPVFRESIKAVIDACQKHGKTPGILSTITTAQAAVEDGFRFVGIGSDGYCLNSGLDSIAKIARGLRPS